MNVDRYFKLINALFILFIIILLLISFNEFFGLHLNRYYPEFYFYECHRLRQFVQSFIQIL